MRYGMSADSPPPGARGVARPLAATMLVQAMVATAVSTVPVLAPALADTYGVRASWIGFYSSLAFAGGIVSALLGGALVRRVGAVRCSQIALLVAAAALAATAGAALSGVAALAIVAGMGYGLATPAASHILARVTPAHRRGVVLSLKQAAVPLGGLIAGLAAPAAALAFGWRAAILCIVAVVFAAAVVIAPLRARLDADRSPDSRLSIRTPLHAVGSVLRNRDLRSLTVAAFSFAAIQSSVFAVFTAFLVETAVLDLLHAGQAFAAMQAAGIVSRVVFGWLSDRVVGARTLLRGFAIGIAAVLLLASRVDPTWSFAGLIGLAASVGFVVAGWPGVYLAEIVRSVPMERVATATGGTVGFSFLGVVVGPASFSIVVAISGSYGPAFLAFAAFSVLIGTVLWRAGPRRDASFPAAR